MTLRFYKLKLYSKMWPRFSSTVMHLWKRRSFGGRENLKELTLICFSSA